MLPRPFMSLISIPAARSVGQTGAALGAAAGQNLSAVGSRHPLAEAVLLAALELLGLIGTLHAVHLPCKVSTGRARPPQRPVSGRGRQRIRPHLTGRDCYYTSCFYPLSTTFLSLFAGKFSAFPPLHHILWSFAGRTQKSYLFYNVSARFYCVLVLFLIY